MDKKPTVSIIIPCRPGTMPESVKYLNNLNYPKNKLEIIIEEGKNPSAQRNRGILKSKGEIIGFTDDDCSMDADWLNNAIKFFSDASVGVVGGPNLTPKDSSFLSYCFGLASSSYFGTATMSTRYEKKKVKGEVTEQNLIFNNLFVKHEIFKKGLMLNEALFPNEENEFLNRVKKNDYKLVYEPEVNVYHPRMNNFKKFARQLYGYGTGRAHQTYIQPDSFKLLYLIPTLFTLGLFIFLGSIAFQIKLLTKILLLFLGIYVLLSLAISLRITLKEKNLKVLPLMPLIFFIIHTSYGIGFLFKSISLIIDRILHNGSMSKSPINKA